MHKPGITPKLSLSGSQNIKEGNYWLEKLSGELQKSCFPYDRQPGAKSRTGKVREKPFQLNGEILTRLKKISSGSDIRLHMLLVTVITVLLAKYNRGSRDIIIGVPVYKQEKAGKFINTVLALRNRLHEEMSFKELLLQVRQTLSEAVEHQNYPIETLLYNLNISSLFDIAVLLENIHDKSYLDRIDLNIIFSFNRVGENIDGAVEYNAKLYEDRTIERILEHFTKLMKEVLFDIDKPLDRVDILSREEKYQLVKAFNDSDTGYDRHKTIVQLFEEQVEKKAGKIAAAGKEPKTGSTGTLTYGELNRETNRLAHLLRSKGVKPGTIVGLLLERTIDMAVAVLAVIKAGGAYLPITPDTPLNRTAYILEDARVSILLTHGANIPREVSTLVHLLELEKLQDTLKREPVENPQQVNQPKDPVYIIFTSGSTGMPKGVVINHQNLHNLKIGLYERIYKKYKQPLAIALLSPYTFDASIKQVFAALLLGHTLYIVPEDIRVDGSLLLDYFENHKIEV